MGDESQITIQPLTIEETQYIKGRMERRNLEAERELLPEAASGDFGLFLIVVPVVASVAGIIGAFLLTRGKDNRSSLQYKFEHTAPDGNVVRVEIAVSRREIEARQLSDESLAKLASLVKLDIAQVKGLIEHELTGGA